MQISPRSFGSVIAAEELAFMLHIWKSVLINSNAKVNSTCTQSLLVHQNSNRNHFQTMQVSDVQCNETMWPTSEICMGARKIPVPESGVCTSYFGSSVCRGVAVASQWLRSWELFPVFLLITPPEFNWRQGSSVDGLHCCSFLQIL